MSVRTWHYRPNPGYRTKDAANWCASLEQDLQGWIADALAGAKRHRLDASTMAGVARSHDEIHCDIAHALAQAVEWDGFSIAHELTLRGWPGDVELVQICNVWSCRLVGLIRARRAARPANLRGDES